MPKMLIYIPLHNERITINLALLYMTHVHMRNK